VNKRREPVWFTGEELRERTEAERARRVHPKLGCLGLLGLWMSRMMMLWALVAMPLAGAIGVRSKGHGWVPFIFVPLLCVAAAAGFVFSVRRWWRPPWWAVMLARAWFVKDKWRGEPDE
jgi:hypothetical protein